jgi:hypothetical protein
MMTFTVLHTFACYVGCRVLAAAAAVPGHGVANLLFLMRSVRRVERGCRPTVSVVCVGVFYADRELKQGIALNEGTSEAWLWMTSINHNVII